MTTDNPTTTTPAVSYCPYCCQDELRYKDKDGWWVCRGCAETDAEGEAYATTCDGCGLASEEAGVQTWKGPDVWFCAMCEENGVCGMKSCEACAPFRAVRNKRPST